MPPNRNDLECRLAVEQPSDTVRGMIFRGALDAVRLNVGEAAAEECLALTGRKRPIDFFSYPVGDYLKLAWRAVELLEPRLGSTDAAFRQLGRQAVLNFLELGVGKTLLAVISSDIRRALTNAPTAYRTTVSYGERTARLLGPDHGELRFSRDFLVPAFHAGVVQTGLEAIGGVPVKVEHRSLGFMEHLLEVSWDPQPGAR